MRNEVANEILIQIVRKKVTIVRYKTKRNKVAIVKYKATREIFEIKKSQLKKKSTILFFTLRWKQVFMIVQVGYSEYVCCWIAIVTVSHTCLHTFPAKMQLNL